MRKEILQGLVDAMLAEDSTPETIKELADMVDDDLDEEINGADDEDQTPPLPEAQKRVRDMIMELTKKRIRAES